MILRPYFYAETACASYLFGCLNERKLAVGQPAVAKLERRTDMYVSNLRRYIEALGGSLEITARFPEGNVNIINFSELDDGPEVRARGRKAST